VAAQGGIFGWVTSSPLVVEALTGSGTHRVAEGES